jgi:hypothetical protein
VTRRLGGGVSRSGKTVGHQGGARPRQDECRRLVTSKLINVRVGW